MQKMFKIELQGAYSVPDKYRHMIKDIGVEEGLIYIHSAHGYYFKYEDEHTMTAEDWDYVEYCFTLLSKCGGCEFCHSQHY